MGQVTYRNDIRNIAIIAHVDHGKTTMVDALLRQSKTFRDNQTVETCVMDSNDLERERGITILAKNTAISYKGVKINIIDTPGHADFGGEVERVINMADGCLLIVDAAEGPTAHTKFVLKRAFEKGVKPILVINKIDRKDARVEEVTRLAQDIFLELVENADQLDFPIIYAAGRQGTASRDPKVPGTDILPLLDTILEAVPPPTVEEGHFQMLISNLDYDTHKGKIGIGRVRRGKISRHDPIVVMGEDGDVRTNVAQVFTHMGLQKLEVETAEAGDIIQLTGPDKMAIGDTICSADQPEALPRIHVSEPTVEMTFGVNTSPFAGREGRFCTSRQVRERLYHELETNLSLRVRDTESPDTLLVSGRGELHLGILVEVMRREGYEFEISKPEAITKMIDGQLMEPIEILTIDASEKYIGPLTELLSKRQARMTNMVHGIEGTVRLEFHIPTKGLIGFRNDFLTATRGEGTMDSSFLGWEKWGGELAQTRSGVMVSSETGVVVPYGLFNAQSRGTTFVDVGADTYEGMIIGTNPRPQDMAVNVCKMKKQTNVRSSTKESFERLIPPMKMSLEQFMAFITRDELLEVTPLNFRARKKILNESARLKARHNEVHAEETADRS